MKKIFYLLIIIISGICRGQNYKDNINKLTGTWVNEDLVKSLNKKLVSNNLDTIIPRFIYIDSLSNIVIENRFEQSTKVSKLKELSDKNNLKYFAASGKKFILLNDSSLEFSIGNRMEYFKKISKKCIIGSGIQIAFRDIYFNNFKNWQILKFKDGIIIESQKVKLTDRFFRLEKDNQILHEYEFTDTKVYQVNGEKQFGIIFFRTQNDKSLDEEVYAIKKLGDQLLLYQKNVLILKLIPTF
jgi:hypothetical protein